MNGARDSVTAHKAIPFVRQRIESGGPNTALLARALTFWDIRQDILESTWVWKMGATIHSWGLGHGLRCV